MPNPQDGLPNEVLQAIVLRLSHGDLLSLWVASKILQSDPFWTLVCTAYKAELLVKRSWKDLQRAQSTLEEVEQARSQAIQNLQIDSTTVDCEMMGRRLKNYMAPYRDVVNQSKRVYESVLLSYSQIPAEAVQAMGLSDLIHRMTVMGGSPPASL